jgi:hypothetical protein
MMREIRDKISSETQNMTIDHERAARLRVNYFEKK